MFVALLNNKGRSDYSPALLGDEGIHTVTGRRQGGGKEVST